MKEKPSISASPSLPFPVRGESQRYDSEPETSSKCHRNGTLRAQYFRNLATSGEESGMAPLDKGLTMWYTTRVEFNDTRIAATL